MIKRILTNILLIFFVFSIVEYAAFVKTKNENMIFKSQADKLEANNTVNYRTKYTILKDFNTTIYRNSFISEKTDKKPVIWFGCSFAEGAGLEDNQTPCYKISQLTGRSCINRSKGATGTQFMYYQLLNPDFIKEVPEADFVIYTFIWNHLQRLYNYQINPLIDMFNLRYKDKNGVLEEIKPVFKPFYSSFFVKRILNRKVYKAAKLEEYNFKLFNLTMKETAGLIKKQYPNAVFIMLEFPELSGNNLPVSEIKKLESFGIKVVRVKDLIGDLNIYDEKYWLPDKIHPTEEAWDIILPELKKRYINVSEQNFTISRRRE